MAILFLVAVLFAFPTYGLSLLAYLILVVVRGVNKAKSRMHHANVVEARRELEAAQSFSLPSWSLDSEEAEVFGRVLVMAVERKGIPRSYPVMVLKTDASQVLLGYASLLEKRGSSFVEQQAACIDFVEEMWQRLDAEHKEKFIRLPSP